MDKAKPVVPVLSRILAQLQRGDIQIPSAPAVVTELRLLTQRADSKIEALVALLERDQALVARLLQLGRSVQYARGAKVNDLPSIIQRVGFRQVATLVETVWSNGCFQIADERYRPIAARISRQSLARALAMRALAERQHLDSFSAYLTGLFADVGASFLLWAIVNKSRGNPPDVEDALAFTRAHHDTIGGAVLKRWSHSELVISFVRRHHSTVQTAQNAGLWNVFIVGSQVARELTQEDDLTASETWPPPELLQACEEGMGLGAEQRAHLVGKLHEEYAAALDALIQG